MNTVLNEPRSIRVFEAPDESVFRNEIFPLNEPALLKGLVRDWPAVRAALEAPDRIVHYIRQFDRGQPVDVNFGQPEIGGRFFYNERMDGFNFVRKSRSISGSMDRILAAVGHSDAPAIYIQSVPVNDHLPGFEAENPMRLGGAQAQARIWIGSRATVQAHFDLKENIACCVAGRRRFTMFPPGQTPNMYPGPFEFTLAGPPVSMVDLGNPDFDKHPGFREAMKHRIVADLEPGDALYIPYFWWHHVEALEDFNTLVNYWWNDAPASAGTPFDVMLHALISLRDLPERHKAAWKTMFDHYVFGQHGDPLAHLPPAAHGTLGKHDDRTRQQVRMILLNSLAQQAGLRLPGKN